jgi:hypothetical protein
MFTIKFYSADGFRQIIQEADSFTILRGEGEAEITLHKRAPQEDCRFDIKEEPSCERPFGYSGPQRFGKAIIENAAGKTTEIIYLRPLPAGIPSAP